MGPGRQQTERSGVSLGAVKGVKPMGESRALLTGQSVLGTLQKTLWRRRITRHHQAAASSDHPQIHTNLACCFRDPGEQESAWTEG